MLVSVNEAYELLRSEAYEASSTSAVQSPAQPVAVKTSAPSPVIPNRPREEVKIAPQAPVVMAAPPSVESSIVRKADAMVKTEILQSHRDLNDMVGLLCLISLDLTRWL
jgi:hypothetical protein